MSVAALIVAAGRGTRLGADTPKQYIPLDGPCALRRSVELFLSLGERVQSVLVVIHSDDAARYASAMAGLKDPRVAPPVLGGASRAASVLNGLEALEEQNPAKVLIHDAARPFVPLDVITGVIDALDEAPGAAAGMPVVDALWRAPNGFAEASVERNDLWRAQTPQGFRFDQILAAHRAHDGSGADDIAVAREAGMDVRFVQSDSAGFKITTPSDLDRALKYVGKTE